MLKISDALSFLDSQVNLTTVAIVLMTALIAWFGFKFVVRKVLGALVALISKTVSSIELSYLFTVGAFIAGPALICYGAAEVWRAPASNITTSSYNGFDRYQLVKMATSKDVAAENVKAVLDYRQAAPPESSYPNTEVLTGSLKFGWTILGLGVGLLLAGCGVGISRA